MPGWRRDVAEFRATLAAMAGAPTARARAALGPVHERRPRRDTRGAPRTPPRYPEPAEHTRSERVNAARRQGKPRRLSSTSHVHPSLSSSSAAKLALRSGLALAALAAALATKLVGVPSSGFGRTSISPFCDPTVGCTPAQLTAKRAPRPLPSYTHHSLQAAWGKAPAEIELIDIVDAILPPTPLGAVVNLGARDGKTHDPTYPLFSRGHPGAAFEGWEPIFPELDANLGPFEKSGVAIIHEYARPDTFAAKLADAGVTPGNLDVLKIGKRMEKGIRVAAFTRRRCCLWRTPWMPPGASAREGGGVRRWRRSWRATGGGSARPFEIPQDENAAPARRPLPAECRTSSLRMRQVRTRLDTRARALRTPSHATSLISFHSQTSTASTSRSRAPSWRPDTAPKSCSWRSIPTSPRPSCSRPSSGRGGSYTSGKGGKERERER